MNCINLFSYILPLQPLSAAIPPRHVAIRQAPALILILRAMRNPARPRSRTNLISRILRAWSSSAFISPTRLLLIFIAGLMVVSINLSFIAYFRLDHLASHHKVGMTNWGVEQMADGVQRYLPSQNIHQWVPVLFPHAWISMGWGDSLSLSALIL